MNFFTKLPWVQFLFSEETIMNVRRLYRHDGAMWYHQVEGGLNEIGDRSFRSIAGRVRPVLISNYSLCDRSWDSHS